MQKRQKENAIDDDKRPDIFLEYLIDPPFTQKHSAELHTDLKLIKIQMILNLMNYNIRCHVYFLTVNKQGHLVLLNRPRTHLVPTLL